ncbi:hypothetical protein [Streptomyces litmocidini]|uniref:hypothetical protein n=1 Tax=Streptomyces litmocidini TaxID=67318 RepID=UPI00167E0F6A|nr:hypothetical protein [Streptomyces litmocidini]
MTSTIRIDARQTQRCGEGSAPGDVASWTPLEAGPEDCADAVGGERADETDFRSPGAGFRAARRR